MEINKKNRTELKSLFQKNKIPTQRHYEQFIDAGINQVEDGIAKAEDGPVALQAEGEAAGTQEILSLFSDFKNDSPNWSFNLNPRVDPQQPESNQPGLNIKDASGQSRLFIQSGDGSIGVGTIAPEARLTVQGNENGSLIAAVANTEQLSRIFEVTMEGGDGMLTLRRGDATSHTRLSGSPQQPGFFLGSVGIGTDDPSAPLHVKGENPMLKVTNTGAGANTAARLRFHHRNNNKSWEIAARQGTGNIEFIPTANQSNRLLMKSDGSLEAPGGVIVTGSDLPDHPDTDGVLYRYDNGVYLTVEDNLYIRDRDLGTKLHFDTNTGRLGIGGVDPAAPLSISGTGKDTNPDAAMHITSQSILFGGDNAGRQAESAKISAHETNSLHFYGMASGTNAATRKVDIWAEGGLTVRGPLYTNDYIYHSHPVMFSAHLESQRTGDVSVLGFTSVNQNLGNAFSGGIFTAPVKGIYIFILSLRVINGIVSWKMILDPADGSSNVFLNANNEGEKQEKSWLYVHSGEHTSRIVYTQLNAGDKVFIRQNAGSSSKSDNYSSSFEGALLHALSN